ncbi:MAG TPA: metallophosphoesterase [Bryobacteraceae bacterium]|nr:metallophosphoesterase [Bryobacteraceae bacterium]
MVLLRYILSNLADMIGLTIILLVQAAGAFWILRVPGTRWPAWARRSIVALAAISAVTTVLAFALRAHRVMQHVSPWWYGWGRGLMLAWALFTILFIAAYLASQLLPRARPEFSAARRNFLRAAHAALFTAPAAAIGYGVFIERLDLRLREENIAIPNLHPDLNGLRIVQLTDIHLSPFLSVRDLDRAVAMANETRAHLALVTGDLISTAADPLDKCLDRLRYLRAGAGIYGCLGNHERYAGVEDYVEQQGAALGMRFLRKKSEALRFGDAVINLAGVDYQRMHSHYLSGVGQLIAPGALNVLMSHNPDVFPAAVKQGWDFTISGHTHGGQVRVEILHESLSIATFFTRYIDGIYRKDGKTIFVSRGIGTIGAPIRLACAPEVALLKLCRA